jgi:hypothetical protein
VYNVGIFFQICVSLCTVPSRARPLLFLSVFLLGFLSGLFCWCSRSMCTALWPINTFLEPCSAWAPCCYLAHHSTEFVGSCKICNFMSFENICNKKSFFLSCCLFFCCLSAFEYLSGYLWNIRVLWQRSVMSFMILVNGKFFLSCASYNKLVTA